jgi:hypothetical protein
VAGPQSIQRFPAGLLNVLNMQSAGETPRELASSISGVLELLQYYGLTQRQTLFATNGALAEAGFVSLAALTTWAVLFAATASVAKTATMTALRAAVFVQRGTGLGIPVVSEELGPFGATETGTVTACFVSPYGILLPPGSVISASPQIIGTDATAACTVTADLGVLG